MIINEFRQTILGVQKVEFLLLLSWDTFVTFICIKQTQI